MTASTHLDWPFFEPRHRQLASALDEWADAQLTIAQAGHGDAECRALTLMLGRDGWLQHLTGDAATGVIDTRAVCLIREALAHRSGLADFAFATHGLAAAAISLGASDKQRAGLLPGLISGQSVTAFAWAEPPASSSVMSTVGSDPGALRCTVRSDGEGYVLDGEKTWITAGGAADRFVVFARAATARADGKAKRGAAGGRGSKDISAFIVEADAPGLEVVPQVRMLAAQPTARLRLRQCRVGSECRLGAEGTGFQLAMRALDVFRPGVAAAALGLARRAFDEAMQRATTRRMFDDLLAHLQLTQSKLAQMASVIDASALLTYRAAWLRDSGQGASKEVAMARTAAIEGAQQVIDAAVQMWSPFGVANGPPVERLYREVRALRFDDSVGELQPLLIGRELLREGLRSTQLAHAA